jgi:hypothetical protein
VSLCKLPSNTHAEHVLPLAAFHCSTAHRSAGHRCCLPRFGLHISVKMWLSSTTMLPSSLVAKIVTTLSGVTSTIFACLAIWCLCIYLQPTRVARSCARIVSVSKPYIQSLASVTIPNVAAWPERGITWT